VLAPGLRYVVTWSRATACLHCYGRENDKIYLTARPGSSRVPRSYGHSPEPDVCMLSALPAPIVVSDSDCTVLQWTLLGVE